MLLLAVARLPIVAGFSDLGVIDAVPASHGLGIEPAIVVSESADSTALIWRDLVTTLWDRPAPLPSVPAVDYGRDVLVLATYFGSSSCAPSLGGVRFGPGGVGTVVINDGIGFGGCTADAVPYTFLVAITRDRLGTGEATIRMDPTPRPGP